MNTIKTLAISIFILLIAASLSSGLKFSASVASNGDKAATGVELQSATQDYIDEDIQMDTGSVDVSNTIYGTGSLPYNYILKSDSTGNKAYAYRSVTGSSGITYWNFDWGTGTPYSSTAGYGVNAWLRFNVANAQYWNGGSYGSNSEGDYSSACGVGSSPGGVYKSSVSNLYSSTSAYTNGVWSSLSANYGTGASYVWFDSSSSNREGESTWHWTDAYGTSSNPAITYSPTASSAAIKTGAYSAGSTTGSYGTSAQFRTHVENKGKMYGHEGTYYAGGGEFGFQKKNYNQLKGSVSGYAYTSSAYLYPSVNVEYYRTALLLDPFRAEYVTKNHQADWGYDAFNAMYNKGHAVTYYRDSSVTHTRVANEMDNYWVSAIKTHMNPNAIEITNAAESDRVITGTELAAGYTNSQGMAIFAGCDSFGTSGNSNIANAVKNKAWLYGGYTYSVSSAGNSLFMSKFFQKYAAGKSARTASMEASTETMPSLYVPVVPLWLPSNHDINLV